MEQKLPATPPSQKRAVSVSCLIHPGLTPWRRSVQPRKRRERLAGDSGFSLWRRCAGIAHTSEHALIELAVHQETSLELQAFLDERILELPDRLLDLLPVGVYVCDRAGLIVRYNRVR